MERKRLTAMKTHISDIMNGSFKPAQGFEPGYILARDGRKLSRVRILATVVGKYSSENKKFSSITLDDSTSTIRAKSFSAPNMFSSADVGNIVDVIGKIREYNNEIHVLAENVQKIDDPNYEILRELELDVQNQSWLNLKQQLAGLQKQTTDLMELKQAAKQQLDIDEDIVEAIIESESMPEPAETVAAKEGLSDDVKEKVLEMIEKCDSGSGCSYQDLVAASNMSEEAIEGVVSELLDDGLCFEPKPGKIKKL